MAISLNAFTRFSFKRLKILTNWHKTFWRMTNHSLSYLQKPDKVKKNIPAHSRQSIHYSDSAVRVRVILNAFWIIFVRYERLVKFSIPELQQWSRNRRVLTIGGSIPRINLHFHRVHFVYVARNSKQKRNANGIRNHCEVGPVFESKRWVPAPISGLGNQQRRWCNDIPMCSFRAIVLL